MIYEDFEQRRQTKCIELIAATLYWSKAGSPQASDRGRELANELWGPKPPKQEPRDRDLREVSRVEHGGTGMDLWPKA